MPTSRRFAYQGSARQFSWYDLRDDDAFTCRCDWSGSAALCDTEYHEELVDGSCPTCDTMLYIRAFPTAADTRAAAVAGDRRAIAELPRVEELESLLARHQGGARLRPQEEVDPNWGDFMAFTRLPRVDATFISFEPASRRLTLQLPVGPSVFHVGGAVERFSRALKRRTEAPFHLVKWGAIWVVGVPSKSGNSLFRMRRLTK